MKKAVLLFMVLQGANYFIQSILGLYNHTPLTYGMKELPLEVHFVGLILGVILLLLPIGISRNHTYAYYCAFITYSLLTIYSVVSLMYLFTYQGFDFGPFLIGFFLITIFCVIITYLWKNKPQPIQE